MLNVCYEKTSLETPHQQITAAEFKAVELHRTPTEVPHVEERTGTHRILVIVGGSENREFGPHRENHLVISSKNSVCFQFFKLNDFMSGNTENFIRKRQSQKKLKII